MGAHGIKARTLTLPFARLKSNCLKNQTLSATRCIKTLKLTTPNPPSFIFDFAFREVILKKRILRFLLFLAMGTCFASPVYAAANGNVAVDFVAGNLWLLVASATSISLVNPSPS